MKPRVLTAWIKSLPLAAAITLGLLCDLAVSGPAISSFSGGTAIPGFGNSVQGATVGWRFTVASGAGVTVTQLGWLDTTPSTPLASAHEVGIWSLAGVLLGAVTVNVNDALAANFRYATIAPIMLAGGTSYVVAGLDTFADGDFYLTGTSSLVMDPMIHFNQQAVSQNNAGFSFPFAFTDNGGGRFGPNFIFNETGNSTIPEPSTLVGVLTAFGLFGVIRMRRRETIIKPRS